MWQRLWRHCLTELKYRRLSGCLELRQIGWLPPHWFPAPIIPQNCNNVCAGYLCSHTVYHSIGMCVASATFATHNCQQLPCAFASFCQTCKCALLASCRYSKNAKLYSGKDLPMLPLYKKLGCVKSSQGYAARAKTTTMMWSHKPPVQTNVHSSAHCSPVTPSNLCAVHSKHSDCRHLFVENTCIPVGCAYLPFSCWSCVLILPHWFAVLDLGPVR